MKIVRVLLGVVFVGSGLMKLLVPVLGDAFSAQLEQAGLPLRSLSEVAVPIVEIGVGVAMLVGVFTRIASLVTIAIMVVAIYVHVVVDDPAVFPLQPSQPIIPLIVIVLAGLVLWRGGGAWRRG
ncbi:MAG: DoxX family protein [Gemmatimonadetes bacterium]|nr:DoxX family protein [Gemmatimonadota bacterium]